MFFATDEECGKIVDLCCWRIPQFAFYALQHVVKTPSSSVEDKSKLKLTTCSIKWQSCVRKMRKWRGLRLTFNLKLLCCYFLNNCNKSDIHGSWRTRWIESLLFMALSETWGHKVTSQGTYLKQVRAVTTCFALKTITMTRWMTVIIDNGDNKNQTTMKMNFCCEGNYQPPSVRWRSAPTIIFTNKLS